MIGMYGLVFSIILKKGVCNVAPKLMSSQSVSSFIVQSGRKQLIMISLSKN